MSAVKPVVCLSLALACALPLSAAAADDHGVMNPDSIKWVPAEGLPKGAQLAVLQGDPSKPGAFTVRLKAPGNYRIPPHWHTMEENVTVLSGAMFMGEGDKLDTSKARGIKTGGFMHIPAKTHHYAYTKTATVIQVTGEGPFDINWIDPADDPANMKKEATKPAATAMKK